MTRVYSQRSHNGAHRASVLDRARTTRKKKPYKILFEAVTQEKKKLHSILTYTANAPLGYSFVPAGHPDLTEYCKEKCRKRNLDVHIVSAKPRSKAHENPEKIAHHVHRIGYHFPNEVISEACDVLGYYVRNGVYHKSARDHNSTRLARSLASYGQRMALHGRPATETDSKTQVRDAVRDMFPKIPEKDLSAIVNHAFEEGSKRVGNAKELTLARRVQLAVVAHIRHTYTDYDRLLKVGSWLEARSKVEHVSLAKLRQWRDEADSDELEETFREVIVIDDDDDDDSSDEDSFSDTDQREPSLEIVSSRATARELQHNEPDDVARVDAHSVSRAPRRTIFLRPMHPASHASAVAGTLNTYSAEQVPRAHARPAPSALPVRPTAQQYRQPLHLAHGRPMEPRPRSSVFEPVRPQHPLQIRDEDGKLYNLQPIKEASDSTRLTGGTGPPRLEHVSSPSSAPHYAREGYVQPSQRVSSLESNYPNRFAPAVASRRASEQDVVLPSIEHEPERVSSPRHIADSPRQYRHDDSSLPVGYPGAIRADAQSQKRKEFHPLMYEREDRYHEQVPKRLKPAYTEGEALSPFRPPPVAMPRQIRDYEDVQGRPRVQPPHYEVVDLTSSSPIQPPHSRDRDGYVVPVRPYTAARPNNYSYAPVQSRGSYYEIPTMESSREIPVHPRMNERLHPLRDYAPVREEFQRPPITVEGRATRSGLVYGGYEMH